MFEYKCSLVRVIDVLVGLLELEYRLFGSSSHQAMQLTRATAEELGAAFGLDVTEVGFWTASLDVCRNRIEQYNQLAAAQQTPPPAG